jgi:hypothetical protein
MRSALKIVTEVAIRYAVYSWSIQGTWGWEWELESRGTTSADQFESSIAGKLSRLAEPQQQEFLSLYNNFPGKQPLSGIIKTNALSLGSGSMVGGIFPIISRINHSCRPNTQHTWNSSTEHETIHTIRDIQKGEEITISYSLGGPSQSRI